MTLLPSHVLQRTYNVLRTTEKNQENYLCGVFRSYFMKGGGSKSTAHRYMLYPDTIPFTLICQYADIKHPHCPSRLYEDIYGLLIETYQLEDTVWSKLWIELLDMCDELPHEDRPVVVHMLAEQAPKRREIVALYTRLLWYTICSEYAERAMEHAA